MLPTPDKLTCYLQGMSMDLHCNILSSTFHRMARKPRVEFAGANYHVIARGNRRATICRPLVHPAIDCSSVRNC